MAAAPDLPVFLDDVDVSSLAPFLRSLDDLRTGVPDAPAGTAPLEDYIVMEQAYERGARCLTADGDLLVITRQGLLGLVRQLRSIEP